MHIQSARIPVILLSAYLLVTGQAQAETIVLELGWDEMRATVEGTDFLPKVRVQTGTDPPKRIKGQLAGITDTAISLNKSNKQMLLSRNEIRSIRLFPRKAETRKNRDRAIPLIVSTPRFPQICRQPSKGRPAIAR